MDDLNSELRNPLIPDISDSSATFGHVIDNHVEDNISRMAFDRRYARESIRDILNLNIASTVEVGSAKRRVSIVALGHVIDDHVEDDVSRMTFDRRFAIWLSKFKFFNRKEKTKEILQETLSKFKKKIPASDLSDSFDEEVIPDLRRSWAFYEHVTLPRYIVNPNNTDSFKRARPGQFYEEGTELYPISRTKLEHISEFGQGTALYFLTVIFLAIITGVAGIINLYSDYFYMSKNYDKKLTVW
eukprot:CAMPEP_0194299862 /NCGR_PEP_ID=MMETSP0169-20130528/60945_1 /TAXON_ID=218684 /ORGANISM="Corethron pennatum, Strain L29A3" /LENGTH=242 /DNA_ID=CAMNT_0039049985 /DNA_START=131 /DNA_END=856 /DNA_ORIENTATION=+